MRNAAPHLANIRAAVAPMGFHVHATAIKATDNIRLNVRELEIACAVNGGALETLQAIIRNPLSEVGPMTIQLPPPSRDCIEFIDYELRGCRVEGQTGYGLFSVTLTMRISEVEMARALCR
jgi:hypothetical protein